ncbi:glycosyltransferase family 25 protein, partial [Planctomycetota bacterium]
PILERLLVDERCEVLVLESPIPPVFWRVLAIDDPGVSVCIVRDSDSVVSWREAGAVREWLCSDKAMHLMHDSERGHYMKIMAGMWGLKCDGEIGIAEKLLTFTNSRGYRPYHNPYGDSRWDGGTGAVYFDDQRFLEEELFPLYRESYMEHGNERPFPAHQPIRYGDIVGAVLFPTPKQRVELLRSECPVSPEEAEEMFILPHLALSDQVCLNGMIRTFAQRYRVVHLPVRRENLPCLEYCLRDVPNVNFEVLVDDAEGIDVYEQRYCNGKVAFVGLGLFGEEMTGDLVDCFYKQAGLDPVLKLTAFHVVRDRDYERRMLRTAEIREIDRWCASGEAYAQAPTVRVAYCVNLDSRPERWQRVESMVADQLKIQRLSATCLTEYQAARVSWIHHIYNNGERDCILSASEKGCIVSHTRAWRELVASQEECALILEDDATLDSSFATELQEVLSQVPQDWDLIYLGSSNWSGSERVNARVVRFTGSWANGLFGYLIRRTSASRLLAVVESEGVYGPIDNFVSGQKHRFDIYIIDPPLIRHDYEFGSDVWHCGGPNRRFRGLKESDNVGPDSMVRGRPTAYDRGGRDGPVTVVTVATERSARVEYLCESLRRNDYDAVVVGTGRTWPGFMGKIEWTLEYLQNADLPDSALVIACDAYDLIFQQPAATAREVYYEMSEGRLLVVSSETGGDMGVALDEYYRFWGLEASLPANRHINSGSLAGTRTQLCSYYTRCLELSAEHDTQDDQVLACHFANRYPGEVHVDMANELFSTVHEP